MGCALIPVVSRKGNLSTTTKNLKISIKRSLTYNTNHPNESHTRPMNESNLKQVQRLVARKKRLQAQMNMISSLGYVDVSAIKSIIGKKRTDCLYNQFAESVRMELQSQLDIVEVSLDGFDVVDKNKIKN